MKIFWFLVILLFFTPLARLGDDYVLTIGGAVALAFAAWRFPLNDLRALLLLAIAGEFPLGVYALHLYLGTPYGLEFSSFRNSFILWSVSSTLLIAAFTTKARAPDIPLNTLLIALVSLGAFQFFMARFFGNTIGYDLVAPLTWYEDIYDTYLRIAATESARAIGPYYEPSIYGRIIVTLAAIKLMQTGRPYLPLAFMFVTAITSLSVGTMLLAFLVFLVWYGRPSPQWIPMLLVATVAVAIGYGYVEARITDDLLHEGSTWTRLIGPLSAIGTVTWNYLVGVPLGANQIVTERLLMPLGVREEAITNGSYEFILYTGFAGLGMLVFGILTMLRNLAAGSRSLALALMMLLIGTVVSSSFLSIESTLLFYIFIVAARRSAEEREGGTGKLRATKARGRGRYTRVMKPRVGPAPGHP